MQIRCLIQTRGKIPNWSREESEFILQAPRRRRLSITIKVRQWIIISCKSIKTRRHLFYGEREVLSYSECWKNLFFSPAQLLCYSNQLSKSSPKGQSTFLYSCRTNESAAFISIFFINQFSHCELRVLNFPFYAPLMRLLGWLKKLCKWKNSIKKESAVFNIHLIGIFV